MNYNTTLEVKQFITEISQQTVEEAFKKDNRSFYFALVLFWRFLKEGAHIVVDRDKNKFGCMIQGRIYDVSGEVTGSGYNWQVYNPQ